MSPLILLAILAVFEHSNAYSYATTLQSGIAEYYGTTTGGQCNIYTGAWPAFVVADPNIVNVAINPTDYASSATCGMCLTVIGSGVGSGTNPIVGNFTVIVTDSCPDCGAGGIEFARNGGGEWNVNWIAVDCPVGTNKITYKYVSSNTVYRKIYVLGHRIPVQSLEVKEGATYVMYTRTADNGFESSSGVEMTGTIPVRLTSVTGEQLEDVIPAVQAATILAGQNSIQFAGFASATASPTAAPTTAPTAAPTASGVVARASLIAACLVAILALFLF